MRLHGLDHVRVLAHDLEAVKDRYRDVLGFALPPRGSNFGHPLGSWQTLARFQDAFYLEFLSIKDPERARTGRPEMMSFLERWEGGHSVVLSTPSAPEAAERLAEEGLAVSAPTAGSFLPDDDAGPLQPGWWLVNFEAAAFRRETVSLIQYRRPWVEQAAHARGLAVQPNGVVGARAVWIAVRDADVARAHFAKMGLVRSRIVSFDESGARGHELPVAPGQSLLLLEATGEGETARFLADRRDAGVMGVTLRVCECTAITARADALGVDTRWSAGPFGTCLRLPAACGAGLALEFVSA